MVKPVVSLFYNMPIIMRRSFIITLMISSWIGASAQTIPCDLFCATSIQPDTFNTGYINVTIHFNGDSSSFINYPHIRLITDLDGDTLATGTLNFFGQIGGTSLDYPVETMLDSIPEDLQAIIHFYFDQDSCILTYPCTTNAILHIDELKNLTMYPNPFTKEITIGVEEELHNGSLEVYNSLGILIDRVSNLSGISFVYRNDELPAGLYYFILRNDYKRGIRKAFSVK